MTARHNERPVATSPGKVKLRLWVRLLRTARPIEAELRRRFKRDFGMTLPKFDVMAALARKEAAMTMTEVSRFLMVSNGNITGLIDRLVADCLVVRVANDRDRRASFVRLTHKGLRLFADMAEAHERWLEEMLPAFGQGQAEALIGQLDDLRAQTRAGGPA